MDLYWNPLLILYIISGLISLSTVFAIYITPKTKKIVSLFYIRLGMIFIALSMILDGIAGLIINMTISIISGILIFPAVLFLAIGVNYILKETYNSITLIIICSLGILLCYIGFLPGAVKLVKQEGMQFYTWIGLFGFIADLLTFIMFILYFYWGLKTWLNAPFLIKKEASIFFF